MRSSLTATTVLTGKLFQKADMLFSPHPYQQEAKRFLLKTQQALLFLDMGLGKTSIVLSAIHELMFDRFEVRKTLVIAPKNVALFAWPDELRKWDQFRSLSFTVLHGPNKADRIFENKDIYITNYDSLPWLVALYKNGKVRPWLPRFNMLVLDESTFVKNETSQRSRYVKNNFSAIKRKVLLTGSPTPNGLIDLYGQTEIVQRGMLAPTLTSFRQAYFTYNENASKWFPQRGTRERLAKRMAQYAMVLSKKDVLPGGSVSYNSITCDFPAAFRSIYDDFEREFFLKLDNGIRVTAVTAATLGMKLRQLLGGFIYNEGDPIRMNTFKAEALKELLETLDGEPLLCAIQFKEEVEIIRAFLGYDVPAINSKTPSSLVRRHIDDWNARKLPLMLVHPGSIAHGQNIQAGGSNIVWYSLPWARDHYDQLNARLDRQGQTDPVIIHAITVRETMDDIVMSALKGKGDEQDSFLEAIKLYRRKNQ